MNNEEWNFRLRVMWSIRWSYPSKRWKDEDWEGTCKTWITVMDGVDDSVLKKASQTVTEASPKFFPSLGEFREAIAKHKRPKKVAVTIVDQPPPFEHEVPDDESEFEAWMNAPKDPYERLIRRWACEFKVGHKPNAEKRWNELMAICGQKVL